MGINNDKKYWIEGITRNNGATQFGMSSRNGCTIEDLPVDDVNAGSTAFDYTKQVLYTFDGQKWNGGE